MTISRNPNYRLLVRQRRRLVRSAVHQRRCVVIASFQTFVLSLSQSSLQHLLSLYPLSDFTSLVSNDEATTEHYRAAQINRDIWFTCPVMDFTWQYTRFGGGSSVRLCNVNQTKFGPIFQYMGIPRWRINYLSNTPYLMNEDVTAGGDNSPDQQDLFALLSGSIAAFAHSGDPTISNGRTFNDWPIAYPDQSEQAPSKEHPDHSNLYVVGGSQGVVPQACLPEEVVQPSRDGRKHWRGRR